MAPPKKRAKSTNTKRQLSSPSLSVTQIPEVVIFYLILPLLSFKVLAKFKSVCKSWYDFISNDTILPVDQCRRASFYGTTLNCMIYTRSKKRTLNFLSMSGSPIGVPDPSFSFLPDMQYVETCSSTNGLLCICCKDSILYVCNPATMEGHFVPVSAGVPVSTRVHRSNLALAFDPINSPDRYKLVSQRWGIKNTYAIFHVFSSDTCKWVESSHEVDIGQYSNNWILSGHLYANGAVHWKGVEYLLCFNPEDNVTVVRKLPFHRVPSVYEIGICNGRLSCTRYRNQTCFDVWLTAADGVNWVKYYEMSSEKLNDLYWNVHGPYWKTRDLRKRNSYVNCRYSWTWIGLNVLPYSGGSTLYLTLTDIKSRKLLYKKIFAYDMNTNKVKEFFKFGQNIDTICSYANTMVRLPMLSQVP